MSLNRTRPNEHRLPDFEELPDGRKRLTRYFDIANGTNLTDGLVDAYGTLDVGPATGTTAGFANLRLVKQGLTKIGDIPVYVKVYEELSATAELQVGGATTGNTTIKLEDGRTGYEAEFLQLVGGSYVPGTVGTTTAPGDASAYLQREECTNDGTIRRIKRTYVYAGQIAQSDDTKNNGALLLRTITSVNTVPGTPSGYTLIATKADPNAGLPILTYTFAKGDGQISQDDSLANNGALLRRTIRHLTAPAAANPISTPGGYTAVDAGYQEADGHRIWTAAFAKGDGQISQDDSLANNGALLRRTIRHLTAPAAANPISTPGGYTAVDAGYQEADGHRIWTAVFAKGDGQISQDIETKYGGTLTITTQTHLGAAPAALTGEYHREYRYEEGFTIWTIKGAVGTGIIEDNTQTRYGGKLSVRTVVSIGTATHASGEIEFETDTRDGYTLFTSRGVSGSGRYATKTSSREGGAVDLTTIQYINTDDGTAIVGVLIDTTTEAHEGFTLFTETYVLASSTGTISTDISSRYGGALTLTTIRSINAPPTGPVGGVLVTTQVNEQDGYSLYTYTWASGTGVFSTETTTRYGGDLTLTTIRAINGAPSDPGGANSTLVRSEVEDGDGFEIYTYTWASGTGTFATETTTRYAGVLTLTTKRAINAAPSDPGGANSTLVRSEVQDNDGFAIYNYTWASGTGLIDEDTETRADGSQLHTATILNTTTGGTPPAGSYLVAVDAEPGDGYTLYVKTYYTPPSNYSTAVNFVVKKPGLLAWSASGPAPSRLPAHVAIAGTAAVTFTSTPSLPALLPISAGCIAYETAEFKDNKLPNLITESTQFADFYAPASGASGAHTTYRGRDCKSFAVSFAGVSDQSGSSLTFVSEAEPYFRTNAVTIYKQTITTGTL